MCSCESECIKKCTAESVCDHGKVRHLTSLKPISIGIYPNLFLYIHSANIAIFKGLIGIENFEEYDAQYKIPTSEYKKKRKIFLNKCFLGDNCVKVSPKKCV